MRQASCPLRSRDGRAVDVARNPVPSVLHQHADLEDLALRTDGGTCRRPSIVTASRRGRRRWSPDLASAMRNELSESSASTVTVCEPARRTRVVTSARPEGALKWKLATRGRGLRSASTWIAFTWSVAVIGLAARMRNGTELPFSASWGSSTSRPPLSAVAPRVMPWMRGRMSCTPASAWARARAAVGSGGRAGEQERAPPHRSVPSHATGPRPSRVEHRFFRVRARNPLHALGAMEGGHHRIGMHAVMSATRARSCAAPARASPPTRADVARGCHAARGWQSTQ